ncbi:DUF1292 domain-containing protein [Alkalihalophilus sp. As8PL]|jgi:uncharacterized protein YrzB (UPF0473 family)|uniref:UPF0473 protein AB3N04_07345 n=2 Tax=Alkalihalophilus TaxID=2893060 RepID=A0AB39BWP9_9BACI|nr:DUF1292 domain-containing protein [Alkalihalophilus lindianensis]MDV2685947.1 DUF1292 domain-containing protein [Alkalihalophilus lindianensis]
MSQEEKERIVIPDENGDEHLFDELFKFTVDETGKSYILVTPVGENEDDSDEEEVEVFAFRYEDREDVDNDIALYPVETDEEWEMVEEMLNTFSGEEEE